MMKTIISIALAAAVGMLSARTAEAATVTSGFYQSGDFDQQGMVSGGNFTVNHFSTGGGVFLTLNDFRLGFLPGPNNPTFVPGVGDGAFFKDSLEPMNFVTIPGGSCGPPSAACGIDMFFEFAPNSLGIMGVTTVDEPFRMA